jgi:hypothetical protein
MALANFDLVDHEGMIGLEPAMGAPDDFALLPCLNRVMVPCTIPFEVPVGFEVQGGGFQEVLQRSGKRVGYLSLL